jgi:hypothetical protein
LQVRVSLVVLLCLVALVATAVASAAGEPRQTRAAAERNLISAQRMLARWEVGLVDPHTRLIRNNVWVRCSGRGNAASARHTLFRCVLGHRRTRVTVTYVALHRNGFEVRERRVTTVAVQLGSR